MPNPIPTRSRELLAARDRAFCLRCLGAGGHLHHRRSRRVRDGHTHCPCNLVTLCHACHAHVHKEVTSAQQAGFIVSQFESEPGLIPVYTGMGLWTLGCDGKYTVDRIGKGR